MEQKPQNSNTYVVNFNTIIKDGSSISLHTNMLQQITSSIQQGPLYQGDVEFLPAISPERLTDDIILQTNSVAINFLVGSDYFWNIIDVDKITLPSKLLLLLSSKLGYLLTGRHSDPAKGEFTNNASSCMVAIMSQNDSPCLSDFGTANSWNL